MIKLVKGGSVAFVNDKGEVCSFIVDGKEYMWNGDEKFWNRRSPTLFPYAGRLKDGKTRISGKEYEGKIHGFLRDETHSLVEQNEDSCVLKVTSNERTKPLYPFDFSVYVKYKVVEGGYEAEFTVQNDGEEDMPFSIGSHPAYMLDGALEDNVFYMDGKENAVYTSTGNSGLFNADAVMGVVPRGGLKLNFDIFERGGMVFHDLGESKTARVINAKTGKGFGINFDDFACCVTWTPAADCPFFCVEPWQGLPDDVNTDGNFESKHFIRVLKAGERETFKYQFFVIND